MNDEPNEPKPEQSEFPLLKDDYVAGVGEEARPVGPTEAPSAALSEKQGWWVERRAPEIYVPKRRLTLQTRRDFLIYGAGAIAAAAGFWWLLPGDTKANWLGGTAPVGSPAKERFLNGALTFDDDVAEALYSSNRLVPTYPLAKAQRRLRNNYNGQTPDPSYIPGWTLTLTGLASGRKQVLAMHDIDRLIEQSGIHQQVTRLICVEGWSMIAGWAGLRFADLIAAYPPRHGAKWAAMRSSVNLDGDGNSDPYFVSIDLPTAIHPQTLLATRQNSPSLTMIPLTVDNGAPMRLLAPMKLGLKNIKAVTSIEYTVDEPPDYWAEEGYSKYDGV